MPLHSFALRTGCCFQFCTALFNDDGIGIPLRFPYRRWQRRVVMNVEPRREHGVIRGFHTSGS